MQPQVSDATGSPTVITQQTAPVQGTPATPEMAAATDQALQATQIEKAKTDPLSPRFAALARQEKQLRQRQQAILQKEEQWKTEKTRYESDYIPKTAITSDLMGTLTKLGIGYDKLAEIYNSAPPPELRNFIAPYEAKIQELESRINQIPDQFKQQEDQNYKQALVQIKNDVQTIVSAAPSEYECIAAEGDIGHDAVVALIEQNFKTRGTILSAEEASKQVEAYLLDEHVKRANLAKVKSKIAGLTAQTAPLVPTDEATKAAVLGSRSGRSQTNHIKINTLTHAATVPMSRPLKESDRRARAIALLKGEALP